MNYQSEMDELLHNIIYDKGILACGKYIFVLKKNEDGFKAHCYKYINKYVGKKSHERALQLKQAVKDALNAELFYLETTDKCMAGNLIRDISEEVRSGFDNVNGKLVSCYDEVLPSDPYFINYPTIKVLGKGNKYGIAHVKVQEYQILITHHGFREFCNEAPTSLAYHLNGRTLPMRELLVMLCKALERSELVRRMHIIKHLLKYHGEKAMYRSLLDWIYVFVWDSNLQLWKLITCYDKKTLFGSGFSIVRMSEDEQKNSWNPEYC